MLNLGFAKQHENDWGSRYVIPEELADELVSANSEFSTGPELRRQAVFGRELWGRLRGLGLEDLDWSRLDVLDVCAGTGFLSFHLVEREELGSLTLVDVAGDELREAEKLLIESTGEVPSLECSEVTKLERSDESFDIAIGNSFAHHFPNVPEAFESIRRLLRPGGWFVGLHEPTPVAVPLESGDLRHVALFAASRRRYLERMRFRGPTGVRPGTTDVWMFEAGELRRLLHDAGFRDVRIEPRYLTRPFVVGALNLHLSSSRPELPLGGSTAIGLSVWLDRVLARVLPDRLFGGLSFAARR